MKKQAINSKVGKLNNWRKTVKYDRKNSAQSFVLPSEKLKANQYLGNTGCSSCGFVPCEDGPCF